MISRRKILSHLTCCYSPSNTLPVSENEDGVDLLWVASAADPDEWDEVWSGHRDLPMMSIVGG